MDAFFKISANGVGIANAANKEEILDLVADRFAQAYGVDKSAVHDALWERETLGSTGFGRGVAIPHARIEGLNRPLAVLLRLDTAVEYDAADGMAVELVFGLLSPVDAGASHLQALAAMSRLVRDEAVHDALSSARSAEALYSLLTNVSDRDVA